MPEEEAIKFAALHLEGVAHAWWHLGLVTLGQDQVTSYAKFMEKLIDCFDENNPELNFKDLVQLSLPDRLTVTLPSSRGYLCW